MNGFVHRNIVFSYYYILCTVHDHLNKISSQLTLKVFFSGKQRQQSTGSRVDVRPASCFHCKHTECCIGTQDIFMGQIRTQTRMHNTQIHKVMIFSYCCRISNEILQR